MEFDCHVFTTLGKTDKMKIIYYISAGKTAKTMKVIIMLKEVKKM